jgi:hypothetical protein
VQRQVRGEGLAQVDGELERRPVVRIEAAELVREKLEEPF